MTTSGSRKLAGKKSNPFIKSEIEVNLEEDNKRHTIEN